MLADPKALQYVLQTSGYRFPKRQDAQVDIRMIFGEGIVWAHGEQHQRQRKIMNPAFSVPQLKSFIPLFLRYANKLVQKWKDEEITSSTKADPIFNVHKGLSRTTLDIIGDAGFGFQFGSLDNAESALSKVYDNLFIDSTLYPHRSNLVFRSLWKYFHPDILWFLRYIPSREYRRFRGYLDFMRVFGRNMISQTQVDTKGAGKDIMSVLLRANDAEEVRLKLSDGEVVDQISVLLLAGHDTTALSLTWWLWELARHPEWQERVRSEVRTVRGRLIERGDSEFSISDLEGMSVMHATLKEAVRLHPIVWNLVRVAGQDDVIPLATPVISKSGHEISAIPIRKGQNIDISISQYNRNPAVWGDDADIWNPERFMTIDKATQTSVGVYANLLTFSAGVRSCIGWRFSVLEMQAIAATLIENFEFSLPPQTEENIIRRRPSGLMAPMADGHPGIWMGLKHGVRRARETADAREARRTKEQAKLDAYQALSEDILSRKREGDYSQEAFDLTTRMLSTGPVPNPEFYTVWNYRRHILLKGLFPQSEPKAINELLTDELALTFAALKKHPKVYWIWNHRRWCLENIPAGGEGGEGDEQGWRTAHWGRELLIVEKMLEADARNFHAWDYRRYVLAGMPVKRSDASELAYTTRKIEASFSNFSAWHQRTKVLPALWASGKLDRAKSLRDELTLVQNAMWTTPEDQSVWLYHRWLIGEGEDKELLEKEIEGIQELLQEQPDSKWCMESLVHYKQLLMRVHAATLGEDRAQTLRTDCKSLLEQLEAQDPMRRQRYRDLGAIPDLHLTLIS
ncbi:cytochrome P450 [Peniophora sp. CONT]|nr:cytochrome P450 [Peniophora sp. CONT]